MNYRNIVYDFDGTLSDTYPVFTEALLQTLRKYGLESDYRTAYDRLKVTVTYALQSYPFPAEYQEVHDYFHDLHERLAMERQVPMEGADEILRWAKANGRRNYIYSHSGDIVGRLLDKWGWTDLFDGILDAQVKLPRKPAPDGLYWLCGKYGLNKAETLMVGDRDIDTDCGKNAGIDGCLFDPEHYCDGAEVTYRILKLTELKDIL